MQELDKKILDKYQRDFPLDPNPFGVIAQKLGVGEEEVLSSFQRLEQSETISRLGAIVKNGAFGASTLAALKVPGDRLEQVAALVSAYEGVNHNYEREHDYNLWFVLSAPDQKRLEEILGEIESRTGLAPLYLPMLEDYHLDLGFSLEWT